MPLQTDNQPPDDPQTAYRAAFESAAVFDVSDRVQFEITGADRQSFLNNFCTNDINALAVGTGCEAFVCNAKGRLLGHIFVFADEETLWIESVPGQAEALRSHFEKYHLLEDMQLVDRTDEFGEFLIHGPRSEELLSAADIDASGISTWQHRRLKAAIDGQQAECRIKRVDLFGPESFLLTVPGELKEQLFEKVTTAGIAAASSDVLHSLRIEAQFPWYGIDLSADNLAQEAARTDRTISFQKGCYLGQEPIARLNAMGHVNRELKSFLVDSPTLPEAGIAILNPKKEEKEIGRMTSVAWSGQHNQPIGLGMVRTQFGEPGTELPLATDPRVTVRICEDGAATDE